MDEYFISIEKHFQSARGSESFLISPEDWHLMEIWKENGVPVVSALRGIDVAFAKHRSTKSRDQINSLKFCSRFVIQDWVKNRVRNDRR